MIIAVLELEHWSPLDLDGRAKDRSLRVAYTIIQPYIIKPTPFGMDVSVMKTLEKSLKVDITYGHFANSLRAMIETVTNGSADLAIGQPTYALQRYREGLDLSPALTQRAFFFFSRHPVPIDSFYTLALPYSRGVWAATAFSVFSVLVCLSLLNRC